MHLRNVRTGIIIILPACAKLPIKDKISFLPACLWSQAAMRLFNSFNLSTGNCISSLSVSNRVSRKLIYKIYVGPSISYHFNGSPRSLHTWISKSRFSTLIWTSRDSDQKVVQVVEYHWHTFCAPTTIPVCQLLPRRFCLPIWATMAALCQCRVLPSKSCLVGLGPLNLYEYFYTCMLPWCKCWWWPDPQLHTSLSRALLQFHHSHCGPMG